MVRVPIPLSTVVISSARLGFGLWSELGQCNVRHRGCWIRRGLRLNH
jgi:hypothetical protein